jgi:hypothetical protein
MPNSSALPKGAKPPQQQQQPQQQLSVDNNKTIALAKK